MIVQTFIAKVLGEQAPNRKNDVALALTKAITTGTCEKVLTDIKANKYTLDEGMMISLAYELLWSNLASKSLQLFAVNELRCRWRLAVAYIFRRLT